ncbi:U-box domain-containing protein 16-like [Cucurbita moschata]|uniref:RING-type E3 ubiquitin transferase n=1 Tax=Cucurbita moschata TaxID=3662 RepID=A0A6J1EB23_CUCMO|nr:U-box domain-containing protein 16-like [Cucurbita moschata]
MAVSPHSFPPRKRRPSAAAFVSPNFSAQALLDSLLCLCQEISAMKPLHFLLNRYSNSMIRKSRLLEVILEDFRRDRIVSLSASASLCLEEMYIVLQRIKTLIEDCSNGSKMWLLTQNESIANNFHELTLDLSTLLDIFPVKDAGLTEDVEELFYLLRNHCSESSAFVDPRDEDLRFRVLKTIDRIRDEIVPDYTELSEIFSRIDLRDSSSCREEIENLEDEVQNQTDEKSRSDVIALIGFVRYAKCVLYGASTPESGFQRKDSISDLALPADFRCPISLDLMHDPVVVATGHTYDRAAITLWIESGHNTCPKTGQTLAHTDLIPNRALKNLIAMWCRQERIPFDVTESNKGGINGVTLNKAALEAMRMTASFLVNKLATPLDSVNDANGVVYELRVLAKTDSGSRGFIAQAGALPLLVRHLISDDPTLQVNAVTTVLNLSILEANKSLIMETDGALIGVIEVLRSGATWEAKGNAAATIFSLSSVHSYRRRLGRKTRVIRGLLDLAKDGPINSKRDALVTILTLAGDRETVGRLIEGGVMETVSHVMNSLPEEAVTILEMVVRKGGFVAIASAFNLIKKLGTVLREGSDRARESAAAALVTMCRQGGSDMVTELASMAGIERVIWEMMGSGTMRGRRKAASLLRILRRWAAGLDRNGGVGGGDLTMVSSSRMVGDSTTIVSPSSGAIVNS